MTDQRAEYLAALQRNTLITVCRTLIKSMKLCKWQATAEHFAMLEESVNESRDTVQEFGGALTANQPLEVRGVKAAGIAPVVWHLANRLLLLAKSVLRCTEKVGVELLRGKEDLVHAYVDRFYGDIDTDWLDLELSIEAAKNAVTNTVNDYDRCRWKDSELDDFLAVYEALPESWVDMDDDARRRWVEGIPPDGPDTDVPKRFWWKGERRDLAIEDKAWELLVFLWPSYVAKNRQVRVAEIGKVVFGDRCLGWHSMKTANSKMNSALSDAGIPFACNKPRRKEYVEIDLPPSVA